MGQELLLGILPAGMALEAVILRRGLGLPARKAILVGISANAASAVLGAVLTGVALMLVAAHLPAAWYFAIPGIGRFPPIPWALGGLLLAFWRTIVDLAVLRRWWPEEGSTRAALALFGANAVTTILVVLAVGA